MPFPVFKMRWTQATTPLAPVWARHECRLDFRRLRTRWICHSPDLSRIGVLEPPFMALAGEVFAVSLKAGKLNVGAMQSFTEGLAGIGSFDNDFDATDLGWQNNPF